MRRYSLVTAAGTALFVAPPPAVAQVELRQQCDVTVPATLDVGGASLVRAGTAVRTAMLGLVDLYAIAVYVPLRPAGDSLASSELPKALWLGVCYDDSLPAYVPRGWRQELVPELGDLERRSLEARFVSLNRGDIATITFDPVSGTTVDVDGQRAIETSGQALMIGFLEHWIGQTPVSDDIKRALMPAPFTTAQWPGKG